MSSKASKLDACALSFRPKRKNTWYSVDEDGKPAKMECGIHLRPAGVSALHELGTLSRYLVHERVPYVRRLQGGETRGSCLCDYHNYGRLLEERETLDLETAFQFPFMKLPAELRNAVYGYILKADTPFEFCPEPYELGCCYRDNPIGWAYPKAKRYHKERRLEATRPCAGIMRVSKQVHNEATAIFYGENEFRFTNLTGWMGLDVFLYRIGLPKSKLLRHITVCHPDFFAQPKSHNQASSFGIDSCLQMWAKFPAKWHQQEVIFDTKHVLEKIQDLKTLRLILPEDCDREVDCPVDETKFANLKVVFVSTKRGRLPPRWWYPREIADWGKLPNVEDKEEDEEEEDAEPTTRSWAQRTVERSEYGLNWHWEAVKIDRLGRYQAS